MVGRINPWSSADERRGRQADPQVTLPLLEAPAVETGVLELDGARGTLLNIRMQGYPVTAPRYATLLRPSGAVLLGDMNGDGAVDFLDIDPFVTALLDEPAFSSDFPRVDPVASGDANGDGALDFADIDPFVDLLIP